MNRRFAQANVLCNQAVHLFNMMDQLTFDDLRAYQAGQLSGPARHRVERLLLENPFYADALAGLEAMQQTATPTADQLAGLRDALQERIHQSATKKRLWPLWIATTTATILFMLAVAIYFIFFAPRQSPKPKPVRSAKTAMQLKVIAPKPALTIQSARIATLADATLPTGKGQCKTVRPELPTKYPTGQTYTPTVIRLPKLCVHGSESVADLAIHGRYEPAIRTHFCALAEKVVRNSKTFTKHRTLTRQINSSNTLCFAQFLYVFSLSIL